MSAAMEGRAVEVERMAARIAALETALRAIATFEPDLAEVWAKEEAVCRASVECAECEQRRARQFAPSHVCDVHYSAMAAARASVEHERRFQQSYGPKEIARAALAASEVAT